MKQIGLTVLAILSLGIVVIASRYFSLDPDVYFPVQRETYIAHQFGIIAHVSGGIVALALGPVQFITRIRTRKPTIHRWIGRVYLLGIVVGSTAGFYMAFYAYSGIIAKIGFAALAVFWLSSATAAYLTIRAKKIEPHRRWMILNFALTFAAVTLRIELPLLELIFASERAYQIVAWLCWIPNLIIAETMWRNTSSQTPEEA